MRIIEHENGIYIDEIKHFEKVFSVKGDLLIKTDFSDFKAYIDPNKTYYFRSYDVLKAYLSGLRMNDLCGD